MLKAYYRPNFIPLISSSDFLRGFNMSHVVAPPEFRLKEYHKYIYVVRTEERSRTEFKFDGKTWRLVSKDDDKHIIPGNEKICPKIEGQSMEYGHEFWWNNWGYGFEIRGVELFIGDHHTNQFDICASKIYDGVFPESFQPTIYDNPLGDARIVEIDNKIYVHSSNLQIIFRLESLKFNDDKLIFIAQKVKLGGIQVVNKDHNYVLTDINRGCIQYLDWFYPRGVRSIVIDNKLKFQDYYINERYYPEILYDNPDGRFDINKLPRPNFGNVDQPILPFLNSGSDLHDKHNKDSVNWGVTPIMSFGTPLVKYGDVHIGVGHLKIHSDMVHHPYREGSTIDMFRKENFQYMDETYGTRYITHFGTKTEVGFCQGYIYVLYFYVLTSNDKLEILDDVLPVKRWTGMYISDAYLPLTDQQFPDLWYDSDYKFTLFFPMGLTLEDRTLTVSGGYGDYYTVLVEYDVDDVVRACRHDITTINFNDYDYTIEKI